MRRLLLCLVLLGAASAANARTASPKVVELFTAQGCDTCAEADGLVRELARRSGILALTFPVDYWNYTGWRDTFAQPEFTARQQAYRGRFRLRDVYTPEVVVDGRRETPATDREKVELLVKDGPKLAKVHGPKVKLLRHVSEVKIGEGAAPAGGAEVWLVRYDPRIQEVKVRTGDNRGKTLNQQNVVRELVKLGTWKGAAKRFKLAPAQTPGLKTVILVQASHGGPILALAKS